MKDRGGHLVPWLVALFFLSGIAGLGYQVLWAKAFGAGIGHEYPATLAVVTAFMSGMALGAFLFDRLPTKLQHYGWLELIIGIWGAGTIVIIPWLNNGVILALGQSPSFAAHWTIVFGAVFLGLFPATVAMGATLPAIERLTFFPAGRTLTGILYSANTGGAMLGALLTAFWMLPVLGLNRCALLFAGLNVGCGLIALQFKFTGKGASLTTQKAAEPKAETPVKFQHGLALRLFFTGLLGIGFEAVMIRALSHVLENTVYTFAVVLAVYLLGTALGANTHHFLTGRRIRIHDHHLFAALALSCLGSGLILRWIPELYPALRGVLGDSVWAVATAESLMAGLVFLIPAFFMGATFTSLARASLERRRSLGWSVGLNSLGSSFAPALIGLCAIPWFGTRIATAGIALGYALMSQRAIFWLVPCCLLISPLLTPSRSLLSRHAEKIQFFREGVMASVAVLENTNGTRVLKVNNRFQMGGTAASLAEARHADIPLLLHPDPRRALFIGLGTGITFSTARFYPDMVADGVELVAEVAEAMPLFQTDPSVLDSANLRVHVADGRRFVVTSTNLYDVVIGDLFHPAQDGVGFLFTREHFAAVRDCLQTNGLFCQWLPLFQMDLSTVRIIATTFRTAFPVSEMWLLRYNVDTPVVGLIGWKNPPPPIPHDLVERKASESPGLREHLRSIALGDTLRLLGCRLGNIDSLPSSPQLNTDEHPIVIFDAPRLSFQQHDDPAQRLLTFVANFSPPTPGPQNPFGNQLAEYIQARDIYLRGLVEEKNGNARKAIELFIQSARISQEFTSGYAQALGIATTLSRTNPQAAAAILRALMEAQPERPVAQQLLERLEKSP